MKFNYNGKEYLYPASHSDITLGQRIELHERYGIAYEQKLKELQAIEDEHEQFISLTEARMLFACQCVSFFTGIELEVILESFDIDQVLKVYEASMILLSEQEAEITIQPYYEFNGERWVIESPKLTPKSKITFNEFLTSKEIVRQLEQLGNGRWKSLQYLCCIYLRKEGEAFNEDWIEEDSDRMQLMAKLPMDIALAVAFFLVSSMNLFQNTLPYSNVEEEREST